MIDERPLLVRVGRSDPAARTEFVVARTGATVVLDVLATIQREHDPSLCFRYSCRISLCGTCTVRVDGRPALACETVIAAEQPEVRIEPLAGLPVVRDLVVDPGGFLARWAWVGPGFDPADGLDEPVVMPPDSPEREVIDPLMACISCGACYSACAMAGPESAFLGPAALARAMALVADSRDRRPERRLAVAAGRSGVDACHYIGACTTVCPKCVDPAGAIRRLRRARLA